MPHFFDRRFCHCGCSLDMRDIDYLPPEDLQELVFLRRVEPLRLVNVSPSLRKQLDVTRLDLLFEIDDLPGEVQPQALELIRRDEMERRWMVAGLLAVAAGFLILLQALQSAGVV